MNLLSHTEEYDIETEKEIEEYSILNIGKEILLIIFIYVTLSKGL